MESGVGVIIFMALVLKIPVAAACWLIWHAVRAEPDPATSDEGGGNQPHRYFRREPKRPKGPRRGPHTPGSQPIPCPEDEGKLRVTRRPAVPRVTADSQRR